MTNVTYTGGGFNFDGLYIKTIKGAKDKIMALTGCYERIARLVVNQVTEDPHIKFDVESLVNLTFTAEATKEEECEQNDIPLIMTSEIQWGELEYDVKMTINSVPNFVKQLGEMIADIQSIMENTL